jgi:uncharacterized delta-60 repeat protein
VEAPVASPVTMRSERDLLGIPASLVRTARWRCSVALAILLTFSLISFGEDAPGDLDPSFGVGGKVTTDVGGLDLALALVLQPDGKLVAAGLSEDPSTFENRAVLVRYLSDGRLDPAFGTEGKVTTDFGGDVDGAFALVLQPDGKLVAAGAVDATSFAADFALARYESGLVPRVGSPTNKEECKHNGWRTFTIPRAFKNQGDCIQFVNTGK